MKCRICGYRANSIKGMGEHYRKKHPSSMIKARKHMEVFMPTVKGYNYCPSCGKKI